MTARIASPPGSSTQKRVPRVNSRRCGSSSAPGYTAAPCRVRDATPTGPARDRIQVRPTSRGDTRASSLRPYQLDEVLRRISRRRAPRSDGVCGRREGAGRGALQLSPCRQLGLWVRDADARNTVPPRANRFCRARCPVSRWCAPRLHGRTAARAWRRTIRCRLVSSCEALPRLLERPSPRLTPRLAILLRSSSAGRLPTTASAQDVANPNGPRWHAAGQDSIY